MFRIALIGAAFVALLGGAILLMQEGGRADLDVPGRTTDSGKNTFGQR